jgi:hypothetical protein
LRFEVVALSLQLTRNAVGPDVSFRPRPATSLVNEEVAISTRMRWLLDHPQHRREIPVILAAAGEWDLARHFVARISEPDLPAALGDQLGPIATVLERAAITPSLDLGSRNVMNFATAMRLYGPPQFRRGGPLEWELYRNGARGTTDECGVDWEVVESRGSFGVIVARWDRPDWYVETSNWPRTWWPRSSPGPRSPRN